MWGFFLNRKDILGVFCSEDSYLTTEDRSRGTTSTCYLEGIRQLGHRPPLPPGAPGQGLGSKVQADRERKWGFC